MPLTDEQASIAQAIIALKFVLHFVGDFHQPLANRAPTCQSGIK
jgi:hypothetical protein